MTKTTKIKLSILLLTAGIAFMPLFAAAATLSLSPANVSVTRGQTFNMIVSLNPQGQANYTVKVKLNYPVALLEVQLFTFASAWLPLTQSGYDLVDNTNGVMIKTAGYPGGISGPATFGTVSFRAKATGSGNVSISSDSAAYDSGSQNILTGVPVSASVAISAPAATPVSTPLTGTVTTPTPTAPTPTPELGEVEEEEEGANLFAAIGNFISLGTGNAFAGALTVVAILAAGFWVYRRRQRKGTGQF